MKISSLPVLIGLRRVLRVPRTSNPFSTSTTTLYLPIEPSCGCSTHISIKMRRIMGVFERGTSTVVLFPDLELEPLHVFGTSTVVLYYYIVLFMKTLTPCQVKDLLQSLLYRSMR